MRVRLPVVALLIGAVFAPPAVAQTTYYWDSNGTTAGFGTTAGTWGTSAFWGTNSAGTGATANTTITSLDTVNFGTATLNYANGTVGVAAGGVTVGDIVFGSGQTTALTLGTAGNAITIHNGITKNAGSAAVSLSGPVVLGAAQTWTNNSSGSLTTGNGANLINNGGFDLTFDGTGNFALGIISNAAVTLTGSGNLIKNGTGRLDIGGINSGFTGTVTVNGGVLQAHNDPAALGNGNLTLNGGVLSFYWSVAYSRTLGTGNGQVQILGGESGFAGAGATGPTINLGTSVQWGSANFNPGKFVLGDAGTTNAAATTFASGIDLNGATRTIVVPAGLSSGRNRSTLSGAISNSTGTAGLVKEGGGYLFLTNNASSWNGSTTVSGGVLDFGGISLTNIGGGSGRNITVSAGAAVRFNTLNNAALNRLVETTAEIGVMTGTTGNNLDFSSGTGANLPNAFLGNWASNGSKTEVSGTLTVGGANYNLGAAGSSGLLGIRSVLSGTQGLVVGQTGGSGIRVNLVAANTFTGETVINAGAKLTIGNNLALQNSALNVASAGGNFALAAGTNTGRITGETAATNPTFGGLIGSRDLFSVFTSAASNNETNLAATAVTGFTLNVGSGNTFTYSGAIGGFGSGASGSTGGAMTLTMSGGGIQVLSGTNTYTGATNVNGGTLLVNGNNSAATGAVTVANTATLGGTGTLGGTTTVNTGGTIRGDSGSGTGVLTTRSVTVTTGGRLGVQFGSGTDASRLNVSASGSVLSLNSGSIIAPAGTLGDGDRVIANLATGTGELVVSGTAVETNGTIAEFEYVSGTGVQDFGTSGLKIDLTGLSLAAGDKFTLRRTSDDLVLSFTPVPEPASVLAGCGGLLAVGVLVRRLRRRVAPVTH